MRLLIELIFAGIAGYCFAFLSIKLFLSSAGGMTEDQERERETIHKTCWKMTAGALFLCYVIDSAIQSALRPY